MASIIGKASGMDFPDTRTRRSGILFPHPWAVNGLTEKPRKVTWLMPFVLCFFACGTINMGDPALETQDLSTLERMLEFYEFIYDRRALAVKKSQGGPWPWSNDPALNEFKFCNVYRELDAGTIHVKKFVLENEALGPADKLFNIIFYRRFNVRYFFTKVMSPIKRSEFIMEELEKRFDALLAYGVKLFNEAYTLSQHPIDKNYRKREKHVQVLISQASMAHSRAFGGICALGAREAFKALQWPNIGPFLSYQILQDMAMDRKSFPAIDLSDFVYVGPGALPGIEIITGSKVNPEEQCKAIHKAQRFMFDKLKELKGKDWDEIAWAEQPQISLPNVQNCLCEFRKFYNLKNNLKQRKRYYRTHGLPNLITQNS